MIFIVAPLKLKAGSVPAYTPTETKENELPSKS